MATRRRRKGRTAAQKRATRKMIAANRGRGRPAARRVVRRRPRRRNPNNNARRSPRRYMRTAVTAPATAARRRRNPTRRMTMRSVMNQNIIPAMQGGAGALGMDILYGYLPIPATMKVGMMRHIIKGGAVIGFGMFAGQFMRPTTAHNMVTGALTVIMHTAMRETMAQFMPNIPLGEYESMGQVPYGTPMSPMGAYVEPQGMGYYNAGQVASPQYNGMGEYMGPNNGNMSAYESGIEGDLMGMGVGMYE